MDPSTAITMGRISLGLLLPLILQASTVSGHGPDGMGLMGYGQLWADPNCAVSCRNVIAGAPLDCPDLHVDHGAHAGHGAPALTAPCIAENLDFLGTLAYCMSIRCPADGVTASKLEWFWATQATGDQSIEPGLSYGAVLAGLTERPSRTFQRGDTLNYTAYIADADYSYQYKWNRFFDWEEMTQSTYVIIIISVGVATPIVFSLMDYLPFVTTITDKLKPYLVYPSTIGTYSVRPLPYLLGHAPTRGQGLYIAMFTGLNIVLGAITYHNFEFAHPWGYSKSGEILAFVGYRTGHISFALLPLTVLFSSRNNVLLWLTDWPFSTFVLLHRWVARLCVAHAVVHSITMLQAYIGLGKYYTDVHTAYWIWGIVAMLCLVGLVFQGVLWLRRASYEVFLLLHIVLAVFVIVGCWYHIIYWMGYTGVYELWIYMVSAVWFFDRMVRVLRVAKTGVRRATVTEVSADTVRVDIAGVRWAPTPGRHAYVYFPTLQPLRAWENHPFSVIPTALLRSPDAQPSPASSIKRDPSNDVEGKGGMGSVVSAVPASSRNGVSLYIRKRSGVTRLLREGNIPVLLDGPYRGTPTRAVLQCDRVILIGGGIGVTGLLGWAGAHPNVKFAWSAREADGTPILRDIGAVLDAVADKVVQLERLDPEALLEEEVRAGWGRVGVVVCGPAGLCDATRAAVVRLGRRHETVFELEVDAFGW
ncbi:hypothetical protein MCOR27_004723 [Pyricularia oryzae]|nr:hypothetical protein MCOR01_002309 [Pyricularia oryzae]KAI6280303.1 hypothetical protein MCOR27_004723 [Pyricularia oryzae]KAI6286155.1 hypothetical protein MCOR26_001232 [Pyricularia oryzae]KAI6336808.1 hypothetical protein MCOR29_000184 [Pyricularia oryzae]KAI6341551.1 hypothetical protein MCOR30_002126 [Pyricularia oryzae]